MKMGVMSRGDFLRPLFALHSLGVALVIWATEWGSLLLIAWGANTSAAGFLRHPGYMIGDFFVLPLAGLLVARFYRSAPAAYLASVGGRGISRKRLERPFVKCALSEILQ